MNSLDKVSGEFVECAGMLANNTMTYRGQEKLEYNTQSCLMNLAVHGLTCVIKRGGETSTFLTTTIWLASVTMVGQSCLQCGQGKGEVCQERRTDTL